MDKSSPIEELHGVGKKRAELYAKLGIFTVGDLICQDPRSYIDYSAPKDIADTVLFEHNVIKARVTKKMPAARIRSGLVLYKVIATDDSGNNITITLYNNRFAYEALELEEEYLFSGKVNGNMVRREMNTPLFIRADSQNVLKPVYRLTEGITSNIISANIGSPSQRLETMRSILSEVVRPPLFLRTRQSLMMDEM